MMKAKLRRLSIPIFLFTILMAAISLYASLPINPGGNQLPLPAGLVSLESEEGQAFLKNSNQGDLAQLSNAFVAQTKRAYCGVATIITVNRAASQEGYAAGIRSEDDLFASDAAMDVKNMFQIMFVGMTLAELSDIFSATGARTQVAYADQSTPAEFAAAVETALNEKGRFVVVNYSRRALGQEGDGHISPIGAYNKDAQVVLMVDVARHKYSFTWVPVETLFEAMNANDGDMSRGYTVVSFNAK
jgi:hypothetical protein